MMTELIWIDYCIIGLISVSIIISLFRGALKELLALSGWILSVLLARQYMDQLSTLLLDYIPVPTLRALIAFMSLLILSLSFFALINTVLGNIISKLGLKGVDRFLGLFFGITRGILIIALLLWASGIYNENVLTQSPWNQSILLPHFQPLLAWMNELKPSELIEQGLQGDIPFITR
jgi:membrane protein required for colicin V production